MGKILCMMLIEFLQYKRHCIFSCSQTR